MFLSYSRRDSEFVRRLTVALGDRGKDVWVDVEGVRDAEVFPEALRRAVESSDAFVFVITPDSVRSTFCEQEVEHAAELNKRIVPLALRAVDDAEIPEAVRFRSWIPASADGDFDATIERLLTALDTDLEWERQHSRLTIKALEWEQANRDRSFLLRGSDLSAAELACRRRRQGSRADGARERVPGRRAHGRGAQTAQPGRRQSRGRGSVSRVAGVRADLPQRRDPRP